MGVKRIAAVLLDMDGLLLDTERLSLSCRREACTRLSLPFEEELSPQLMGRSNAEVRQIFLERYGLQYPFEAVEAEADRLWEEYMARYQNPNLRPGVFELLDFLKAQGIPCAVATSTIRKDALPLLEGTGIFPYLKDAVYGDMVPCGKPAPDIFLLGARRLGAGPGRCLVLEDSPNGIRAAHRAGMIPVMIPDLVLPDKEIRALARAVLDSLSEVPSFIRELEAAGEEPPGSPQ